MASNGKAAVDRRSQEAYFGYLRTSKPFQTLREQGMPGWLLIYNISGEAFFRHTTGELESRPGEVVLVSPGLRHEYGTGGAYTRLFAHFHARTGWQELLQWPETIAGIGKLHLETESLRRNVERCLREAVAYGMRHDRRGEAFAINALERALLWCESAAPRADTPQMDQRIARALDYLTGHYSEPIMIETLARHCGLSVSRFCGLFRQGVHETPQRYLESLRINRARQLLRLTPNLIQEISAECGYADPFYFSLRFKQRTGLSPRAYRQRYGAVSG